MRTFEDDRSASSAMATSRSGTRSSSREEGFLGFLGMEIFSSPATYHRRSRSRAWRRSIGTSSVWIPVYGCLILKYHASHQQAEAG